MRRSTLPAQVLPVEQPQKPFFAALYRKIRCAALGNSWEQHRRYTANVKVLPVERRVVRRRERVHNFAPVGGHLDDRLAPVCPTLVGGERVNGGGEEDVPGHWVYHHARPGP